MAKSNIELAELIMEYAYDESACLTAIVDAAEEVLAEDKYIHVELGPPLDLDALALKKDELGNRGIALGLMERQSDDLLAACEGLLRAAGLAAPNALTAQDPACIRAREVIAKCKAGETKPTVKATSETVDDCTIKLFFTDPEDLEAFVASYQPKVK